MKHFPYTHLRIGEARKALTVIHTQAEDFAAEVTQQCAIEVSARQ